MKRALAMMLLLLFLVVGLFSCDKFDPNLNENTFFYAMTTIQMYPEEYVGTPLSYDCFTYRLTDVDGKDYLCGVRKCSVGYGCNCGKDTIIGFILDYDGVIPEPKNQSEDTPDKTWIHVEGSVASAEKEEIVIHAYDAAGQIDLGKTETVIFYHFTVTSLTEIEDASGLSYYVTK